jgi:pyruvate dehydrogenase (quinone)/pyruvate oxidase
LQIVKDMLDEASFDASPGHVIPDGVGKAASRVADKLRRQANPNSPD